MLESFFILGEKMKTQAKIIYTYLDNEGIDYQTINHPPVYTAEAADKYVQNYHFIRTKNLFLKNKAGYYLVALLENKRLDMKKLKQRLATSRFSFARPEELKAKLQITSGAVSPFNLINDEEHQVTFIVDTDILRSGQKIGCHPNDNTATIVLAVTDLLQIVKKYGNPVKVIEL
ncbi:prolyl-tRNA synthetase associated domain-containing protein [Limosilactobacillus sp. Lr3000]|uniref:Prolyl-tRNA synthetase associated domain-containing protein n=2 Tax=Limosilactobacillus albertensis TaxID=2759752 RepID=A0A839H7K4_9LACO|nr:prolyl-tRNA synthetase associated domain-containing protein [Limosilactobacillus albertensis]